MHEAFDPGHSARWWRATSVGELARQTPGRVADQVAEFVDAVVRWEAVGGAVNMERGDYLARVVGHPGGHRVDTLVELGEDPHVALLAYLVEPRPQLVGVGDAGVGGSFERLAEQGRQVALGLVGQHHETGRHQMGGQSLTGPTPDLDLLGRFVVVEVQDLASIENGESRCLTGDLGQVPEVGTGGRDEIPSGRGRSGEIAE